MATAYRFDRIRLDAAPSKAARVDQWGFLRYTGVPVTRTGVLEYRTADGRVRREYRPPEEVFHPDSLATLAIGVPVVLEHPPEGDGRVTPDNAHLAVGMASSPRVDIAAGHLIADISLFDAIAQSAALTGTHRELSCGYICVHDETPGTTPDGQKYDAVQRQIRHNHVAQTKAGRAGRDFALPRMDGDNAIVDVGVEICSDAGGTDETEAPPMTTPAATAPALRKVRLDGLDFELPDTAAQAVERVTARCDALTEKVAALEAANTPEKINARVTERVALVSKAVAVLGDTFKADSLSDDDVRLAVIKKVAPNADLAGKGAAYIAARYDLAVEEMAKAGTVRAEAEASHAAVRIDSIPAPGAKAAVAEDSAEAAFQRHLKRQADAWKPAAR